MTWRLHSRWEVLKKYFTRPTYGHCGSCGGLTDHYDYEWFWFVCSLCNSHDIAEGIYEHVMWPNGRNNEDLYDGL